MVLIIDKNMIPIGYFSCPSHQLVLCNNLVALIVVFPVNINVEFFPNSIFPNEYVPGLTSFASDSPNNKSSGVPIVAILILAGNPENEFVGSTIGSV